MRKIINAYVGKCNENDPKSLEIIKRNFIATLKRDMISNMIFCNKNGQTTNCDITNVKVYCGKSKRSGDVSREVVSVEIIIRDSNPIKDRAKALQQHEMMKMDLDAGKLAGEKKLVSTMSASSGIRDFHIEGYDSQLACKPGETLKVRQGDGDELARSSCGKKLFCGETLTPLGANLNQLKNASITTSGKSIVKLAWM